jgi:hypothetical protein
LLNTRNSFFGKENNYEVFTDWFTNLT